MVRALAGTPDSTDTDSAPRAVDVGAAARHAVRHLVGNFALGDGVVLMMDIDRNGKCSARLANARRTGFGTVPGVVGLMRECAATNHVLVAVFTSQGMQCVKVARAAAAAGAGA